MTRDRARGVRRPRGQWYVSDVIRFALVVPLLTASVAAATPRETMVVALEALGHVPTTLAPLTPDTAELGLAQLGPPLHEVGALWGLHVAELGADLLLRTGYRFARGALPEGSRIGSAVAERYGLDAVPLGLGLRSRLLPFRVQLLLGFDAGGTIVHARYTRAGGDAVRGGWSWTWEGRLLAGAELAVWEWLSAALYVEGRLGQALVVERAPDIDPTGIGIGLSLSARFARPTGAPASAEPGTHDGTDLKEYSTVGPSRLDQAFALIREADEKAKRRDFIAAEDLYRRALGLLPLDAETQRNVAAPVHVDWARTLVEIGRSADARAALRKALEIAPDFAAARQMLEGL